MMLDWGGARRDAAEIVAVARELVPHCKVLEVEGERIVRCLHGGMPTRVVFVFNIGAAA